MSLTTRHIPQLLLCFQFAYHTQHVQASLVTLRSGQPMGIFDMFSPVQSLADVKRFHEHESRRQVSGQSQGSTALRSLSVLLLAFSPSFAPSRSIMGVPGETHHLQHERGFVFRTAAISLSGGGKVPHYLGLFRSNVDKSSGDLWKAQSWASLENQRARYKVMTEEVDFHGLSLLDVGCGQGDLASYLETRGILPAHFRGVDGIPEFVAKAKQVAPAWADYVVGDPLADPSALGSRCDWVVHSGVLQNMTPDEALRFLEVCWKTARRGMAFNFLSRRVGYEYGQAVQSCNDKNSFRVRRTRPEDLVEWGTLAGAKKVCLRHDYLGNNDATIIMWRDDTFDD